MSRGFSLVELSIVLVILGLLVGGILAGQSLIRASELRAVSTEHARYATAIHSFRDKYFEPPGEFRSATRVWGRQVGTADCVTNSGSLVATPGACDGNNDGQIGRGMTASTSQEIFQFFRHLALAGLIEGSYTGISGASNGYHGVIGTNLPPSKMSKGAWYVYRYAGTGDSVNWAIDEGNFLGIGANVTDSIPEAVLLRPEEAWNIDTKMDDGRPAYGKVLGIRWNNACSAAVTGVTANTNFDAAYRLSDPTPQCGLHFIRAF